MMQTDQELAKSVGKVMLHVVQPEPLTVSPAVAQGAASVRTVADVRLQRILDAGRLYYAARRRFIAWSGPDDENERLLALLDSTRAVFQDACESYFINSAECGS
jgi:hypothetical protein